jgi:hypothetical protein
VTYLKEQLFCDVGDIFDPIDLKNDLLLDFGNIFNPIDLVLDLGDFLNAGQVVDQLFGAGFDVIDFFLEGADGLAETGADLGQFLASENKDGDA